MMTRCQDIAQGAGRGPSSHAPRLKEKEMCVLIREHVRMLTLDETVYRLTFGPDPPPP